MNGLKELSPDEELGLLTASVWHMLDTEPGLEHGHFPSDFWQSWPLDYNSEVPHYIT